MNLKNKLAIAAGLATAAGGAMAQSSGPDVSAVVTVITGSAAAIASIGIAVLSLHYGAKVYKWVRQAG